MSVWLAHVRVFRWLSLHFCLDVALLAATCLGYYTYVCDVCLYVCLCVYRKPFRVKMCLVCIDMENKKVWWAQNNLSKQCWSSDELFVGRQDKSIIINKCLSPEQELQHLQVSSQHLHFTLFFRRFKIRFTCYCSTKWIVKLYNLVVICSIRLWNN